MGVKSLWEIIGPAARPVKLEALSRKKLAVDASLWIYQFLKAARDKEGDGLNLSHIVGFFRRICKLLFFGILPLFVFDGGAPALKRQVIQSRREKREGNRENMTSTARKLLAMRLHKKDSLRPVSQSKNSQPQQVNDASSGPQKFTYLSDMPLQHDNTTKGKKEIELVPDSSPKRPFRKKDEYDLPDLKNFTARKGDERIMPKEEYNEYDEKNNWDFVDGIRVDSIDPSSKGFSELPMATQYMILSRLRLRSRLRLGYSKDQLEELFPDSRDFSKFQIEQVQKRNFYTQQLMNVNGMGEDSEKAKRIAGDKDKLYVLVKNDDGWTLSLDGNDNEKPVDLDSEDIYSSPIKRNTAAKIASSIGSDSDENALEDVELERKVSDGEEIALVRAIYDQYEDEFEDIAPTIHEKQLADCNREELRKAIDSSKEDYSQIMKNEKQALENFACVPGKAGFNLCESILFCQEKNDTPMQCEHSKDTNCHKENKAQKTVPVEETGNQTLPPRSNIMPSWFGEKSLLSNPHQEMGFLSDKEIKRALNEDEEMGIIDWTEAKELMRNGLHNDENRLDESELEEVKEVRLAPEIAKVSDGDVPKEHVSEDRMQKVRDFDKPVKENTESAKEIQRDSKNKVSSKRVKKKDNSPKSLTANELLEPISSTDELQTKKDSAKKKPTSLPSLDPPKVSANIRAPVKIAAVLDYDLDNEEDELLFTLMDEEEQEHASFASSLKMTNIPISTTVSDEQLLQEQLLKAKRDAEEVTETMINDVQELLKRFGIPFITAPMEAEAQCAELFSLGLVDGIVTDDSDCFLFGGSRVYKNMFNQKQYVECYTAEDIENKMGLDRDKLIELALLLGSDYTEGIKGVGPVLAMEILAEFGDLRQFKEWFDRHTKTTTKDKDETKLQRTLLTRIRNGKLFLPESFPDSIVANAYYHAEVDRDDSEFKWGIPRLDQVRSFLMYNVRWSQERVDEVMVPLIQNLNKQRREGKQTTIGEFFPQEYISYKKDVGLGKRMKVAASKLKAD